MNSRKRSAAKPPAEISEWDETAGLQPEPSVDEPGSAVEQGAGMEFLDNSVPNRAWKDAYMDFFRRE